MGKNSGSYYAVKKGRQPGIYRTWPDAEQQTKGFEGAQHKKFKSIEEARTYIGFSIPSPSGTPKKRESPHSADASPRGQKRQSSGASFDGRGGKRARSSMVSYDRDPATDSLRAGNLAVYADGSCIGNGKWRARAGIGLFWVEQPKLGIIAERLPGKVQTNNRAELYAFIRVFELDPDPTRHLDIYTDSQYAIQCVTMWASNWAQHEWKTSKDEPVENQDLIRLALQIEADRPGPVRYNYVKAHCGVDGNEKADKAAKQGAMMPEMPDRDLVAELDSIIEQKQVKAHNSTSAIIHGFVAAPDKGTEVVSPDDIPKEWILSAEDEAALLEDNDDA